MAIEEITLSTPFGRDGYVEFESVHEPAEPAREELDAFVRDYIAAARARDAFAFTERTRERRNARFNLALKSLVKSLATEASRTIEDRSARADLRTRLYATMMLLAEAASRDRAAIAERARRALGVGLAIGLAGFAGVAFTLLSFG